MMNQPQYVIVDLKNGFRCEGILAHIDKVNFKINLNNVKKYSTDENGKMVEENFETLEINKEDIKEVKLVQYDAKEEKKNINAIPDEKMSQSQATTLPKAKSYNKNESFFDSLTPLTNNEAKVESIKYNDKNAETFNLPANTVNSNQQSRGGNRGRGGYYGRGRGGQNRGGGGFPYSGQQYNNNRRGRGKRGNRGGRGYYRGGNQGGYQNNFQNYSNPNYQNLNNQMSNPTQNQEEGVEKSIYDKF